MPVTTYISHGAVALYKDTGIGHTEDDGEHQSSKEITESAGAWYSLDGVRLDGKPTKKGLYIHGGKKVVAP